MSRAVHPVPIVAPYGDDLRIQDMGSGWLGDIRRHAAARFIREGIPQKKWEHWQYTNLNPLLQTHFKPLAPLPCVDPQALKSLGWSSVVAPTLIFVDGHLVLNASQSAPQGIEVVDLATASEKHGEVLTRVLGKGDTKDNTSLAALNGAILQTGAFILATKNMDAKTPVHLLFVSTGEHPTIATHPRVAILAEPHSSSTVLESHVALGDGIPYWTNAVVGDHCRAWSTDYPLQIAPRWSPRDPCRRSLGSGRP